MKRKENVPVPESGTENKKNIAKKLFRSFRIIYRTFRNAFMGIGMLCMLGGVELYQNSQMQNETIITSVQSMEIAKSMFVIFISLLMVSFAFEIFRSDFITDILDILKIKEKA